MALVLDTLGAFRTHGYDTLIDVRSPSEFAEDRIPGAINLPVLDDAERARVGTIYKQESPFLARKVGAALVVRNAARHLEGPLADMGGAWRPLVYCWRGGQRSGFFATLLREIGWRAETVSGGYRSYRRLVAGAMHDRALPHRLILLDGNTGSAKTEVLGRLGRRGVQVVDLEGLAVHRGSVFGGRGRPQPSQKAFETMLAIAFDGLDPARPVVVEAESSKIGERQIPPAVWSAMRDAPRIGLAVPRSARARYLVTAYGDVFADHGEFVRLIRSLRSIQGAERVERWVGLAEAGEHLALMEELTEQHYDPRYTKWRERQEAATLGTVGAEDLDDAGIDGMADAVAALIR